MGLEKIKLFFKKCNILKIVFVLFFVLLLIDYIIETDGDTSERYYSNTIENISIEDESNNMYSNVFDNNDTEKEDYEFETIKGYTTLQSLILSIDDDVNLKKIKNMAYYSGYYIKDSTGVEANGIIKIMYNTGETEYYSKATEYAMFYFEDFSGKKLWKIEYGLFHSSIKYTYYVSDHSKSNVSVYNVSAFNEEKEYYENKEDAFNYINQKVGYEE